MIIAIMKKNEKKMEIIIKNNQIIQQINNIMM
jgi:hypothetical protein